jgi:regulator of cell morphogenesis and NO signaling
MFDRQQTVASLVLDHSECAEVFRRNRIDFCCRGEMSIEAAAAAKGLDVDALVTELSRAIDERRGPAKDDPRAMTTAALVEHVVAKHHVYLRKALPFVTAMAAKVSRVHGEHNPKLRDLYAAVEELSGALIPHLDEEERAIFPVLAAPEPDRARAATLLASMTTDHHEVAAILERIRAASEDFKLPEWACNSYRTLFSELRQLEGDVFVHVHLENHVLAPRFT